ncbi:MAG TPA: hypothetical protein VFJ15_05360 [Oleiagrimonas sp.]|nr:hypothetical protein [Oleiagrimonas sp.]
MSHSTIALSGLDEADAAMFTQALDAMPGDTWELVDRPPCTLLVVDIDTVWGHMDWLRATANGQQVITYTHDAQVRGCELIVQKPLQIDKLGALLESVENAQDDTAATAAPPAAPTSDASATRDAPAMSVPELEPEVVAEPVSEPPAAAATAPEVPPIPMTLGECLLADRITGPVAIKQADGLELALDPERGGYTGPSALKPLEPLLDAPMSELQRLTPAATERMREAPALPLTRLLWFAALSSTPGQLSPSLDPQAHYRLARWPQIEREFPRHFRIATAMMKRAGTLGDIASAANAPVADVADFVNAYSVAGYVTSEGGDDGGERDAAVRGGMFSRLRKPFSRSTEEPA